MTDSVLPSRRTWPLKVAITALILPLAVGVILMAAGGRWFAVPGSLLAIALHAVLGRYALRGSDGARWIMFTFALISGMIGLAFTFVRPGQTAGFIPWLTVVPIYFGCICFLTALPVDRRGP